MARFGARLGMIGVLVTVSVGLVLVGLGGSVLPIVPLVAIGLVLFGFGNGAVDVMMNVEGAEAEREIGKTLMPLMHAFFSFGTVAGAGSRPRHPPSALSVSIHLGIIAVLIAVAVSSRCGSCRCARSATTRTPTRPREPWTRACARAWRSGPTCGCCSSASSCSACRSPRDRRTTGSPSPSSTATATTSTTGAAIFTVFTVAITGARVLGGPFIDRFGRVLMLQVMAAIGVVGLALFILRHRAVDAHRRHRALGHRLLAGVPGRHVGRRRCPISRRAARVTAVAIIGYCAFLVGPPFLGFIGEQFGILNALLAPRACSSRVAAPAGGAPARAGEGGPRRDPRMSAAARGRRPRQPAHTRVR